MEWPIRHVSPDVLPKELDIVAKLVPQHERVALFLKSRYAPRHRKLPQAADRVTRCARSAELTLVPVDGDDLYRYPVFPRGNRQRVRFLPSGTTRAPDLDRLRSGQRMKFR